MTVARVPDSYKPNRSLTPLENDRQFINQNYPTPAGRPESITPENGSPCTTARVAEIEYIPADPSIMMSAFVLISDHHTDEAMSGSISPSSNGLLVRADLAPKFPFSAVDARQIAPTQQIQN